MKQLIVPVAIIIALIAFFVIIDRKEFSRHDAVQTVQNESPKTGKKQLASVSETKIVNELNPVADPKPVTEAKPKTDAKSAEIKLAAKAKSTEIKPIVELKPTTETKSAEMKSVAETKADKVVETKTVAETKPTEVKPFVETKQVETKTIETKLNPMPTAVPIATEEEAKRLNAFAIFLSTAKSTVVEGEITERSVLPAPEKSEYPNCRFTVHFFGNSITFGEPCPRELSLIVEGFANYTVLDTSTIMPGDKVECCIVPFDCLPEDFQSTQQADDLNLFLLENYYVVSLHKIDYFTDDATMPRSGIFFSNGVEEYVSIFERNLNKPISQEVKNAQEAFVHNDLNKMKMLLKDYNTETIQETNRRFSEVWNDEKEKDPPGYNRVEDQVWRNIDNSFWSLPVNYTLLSHPNKLTQRTIDCFKALKETCESNGVLFIVSLVPYFRDVSARVMNKEFRNIPDLQTASYVKQLSENGVETIYATDAIVQNYNRFPFAYFYPFNSHPSETTQDVISDILAERLKQYDITPELDPNLFSVVQIPNVDFRVSNCLFPEYCDIGDNVPGDFFKCRGILYNNQTISKTSNAPIMVLGNSFIRFPTDSPDALPSLLSMKMLSPVDYHRIEYLGPFTSIILSIINNPEKFLLNKKVVIMQFGTNHLFNANAKSLMVNIREADENRILLNKKKIVLNFDKLNTVKTDVSIDNHLWENLPQKKVYVIGEDGSTDIASFSVESVVDPSANIVCMIPAICFRNQSASLIVNGETKDIPSFVNNPSYLFIAFKLPPGTKTIDVRAEGTKNSVFAIKGIQIWQ